MEHQINKNNISLEKEASLKQAVDLLAEIFVCLIDANSKCKEKDVQDYKVNTNKNHEHKKD